jgi:hypothetical protein
MSLGWHSPRSNVSLNLSAFAGFKWAVANAMGIELGEMHGYGGKRKWSGVQDPIAILFQVADVGGRFEPEECRIIAARLAHLRELDARLWRCQWFIEEFEAAAEAWQPILFSV